MNSAANVNMTVERNGESIQVNINNAQIAQDAAALQAPTEEPALPELTTEVTRKPN